MWWGAYGAVIFRAAVSPRSVRDSQAWRVRAHERLGAYPTLEHLGPELRRLTLEIDLLRRFTLPLTPDLVLALLTGYADRGESQALIIGLSYAGDFVIERLNHDILASDTLGMTRHMKVSLELTEVRA